SNVKSRSPSLLTFPTPNNFLLRSLHLSRTASLIFKPALSSARSPRTGSTPNTKLAIKQINAGSTEHEQTIRIEGGLPALPGTNITMPMLDGHATNGNGHALAAPTDAVPAIEAAPKAQDPEPPPQDPEL